MWECATKKHEAYKVAILKALSFLATKANLEHLRYIYLKLKSLPYPELDKFCLGLLRAIAKRLSGEEDKTDDLLNDVIIEGGKQRASSNFTGAEQRRLNLMNEVMKDGIDFTIDPKGKKNNRYNQKSNNILDDDDDEMFGVWA